MAHGQDVRSLIKSAHLAQKSSIAMASNLGCIVHGWLHVQSPSPPAGPALFGHSSYPSSGETSQNEFGLNLFRPEQPSNQGILHHPEAP